MIKLYHETTLDAGLSIAERGAILSPLQQKIEEYNGMYEKNPDKFREFYGMDYEKKAEEDTFELFGDYEIEYRAKCISFWIDNFSKAVEQALCFESSYGGLLLEMEIGDAMFEGLKKSCTIGHTGILYVPKEFDLRFLTNVGISSRAEPWLDLIKERFDKYKASYFFIS